MYFLIINRNSFWLHFGSWGELKVFEANAERRWLLWTLKAHGAIQLQQQSLIGGGKNVGLGAPQLPPNGKGPSLPPQPIGGINGWGIGCGNGWGNGWGNGCGIGCGIGWGNGWGNGCGKTLGGIGIPPPLQAGFGWGPNDVIIIPHPDDWELGIGTGTWIIFGGNCGGQLHGGGGGGGGQNVGGQGGGAGHVIFGHGNGGGHGAGGNDGNGNGGGDKGEGGSGFIHPVLILPLIGIPQP